MSPVDLHTAVSDSTTQPAPDPLVREPEQTVRQGTAWQRWLVPLASAVLVPALLLAVVEGTLRAFNVGFPTSLTQPCTIKGQPADCYNLFFVAPFFPPGMIKTPQVYAIPAVKPAGTYRIFVLGESAAMGDPDPAYASSRYLEVMLQERYPGMKFEMANTGSVAINSHVSLLIAEGLEKFHPDLVIIYSGNNEVVGPYGPGTALTSSSMMLPLIRTSIWARSTRTGQLLTKLGTPRKEWGGMEMFMGTQIPATSPLLQPTYDNFAQNLRDTVRVAKRSGARVVISTVATNLRDCAPFASLHRANLSSADLASWSELVERGRQKENSRDYAGALKDYFAARQIDDQYAELEFRIAHALQMTGDDAATKPYFERARDLDTLRFRADSKMNEINRKVAAETDSELVDADALFAKISPGGVIDSELIYEHVHLTPEGNYHLAQVMFLQIVSQLSAPGRPPAAQDVLSQAECERRLALTTYDRSRIAAEMFQRLQRPPFTNQINHADQLLQLSMKSGSLTEDPNQTLAEYEWAIARRPGDRQLHYNFGQFLWNYRQFEAAAQELKLAQPWDGFPVVAPNGAFIQ